MNTIANPSSTSAAINEIDGLAKRYATIREVLSTRVSRFDSEVASLHRRCVPGIKSAAAEAADLQAQLVAAIQSHSKLFVQPRTMSLHGIKVGFAKGKGAVNWDCDDEQLVARIEKMFAGDDAMLEVLINTTKKPSKEALKSLDAKLVAKLGVTVEATGDYIVVKASETAVDKLVAKILKEGAVEEAVAA